MKDRHGMAGLFVLMFCFTAYVVASALRTLGLADDTCRLIRELPHQNTTVLCSILLYGTLTIAVGIRAWASYKKHRRVKWFSGWNIALATAAYGCVAYILSVNDSLTTLNAALNPMFWLIDNYVTILMATATILGFIAIIYVVYLGVAQLRKFFFKRSPITDREINDFTKKLNTTEKDFRKHPEFRGVCDQLRQERKNANKA